MTSVGWRKNTQERSVRKTFKSKFFHCKNRTKVMQMKNIFKRYERIHRIYGTDRGHDYIVPNSITVFHLNNCSVGEIKQMSEHFAGACSSQQTGSICQITIKLIS